MSEVLSQNQIDQLLSAISTTAPEKEDVTVAKRQQRIKIYDFKRPDKFSKEQIRTVSVMNETFARLMISSLSAYLRAFVHVHVFSVDQLTYEEFIRSIPNPTTMAIINMDPLKGSAVLEIDPVITFTIIDRLFGGQGSSKKYARDLTDIERAVTESIIVRLLGSIRKSWSQVTDLRPRLMQVETNPQFVQVVPPTEMVLLVSLETRVNETEGIINLCFPHLTIEPIVSKLSSQHWYSLSRQDLNSESSANIKNRIADIPVDLNAVIGTSTLSVRDAMKLRAGDYIRLPEVGADQDIELRIAGKTKFLCRPGRVGNKIALQIVKQVDKIDENEIKDLVSDI